MTTMGKAVGRGRKKKKQEPLECSPAPLKKKRGRKRRSPSPPPPPGPVSFFKVMVKEFKSFLYIPPLLTSDWKGLDKKYVYIEDADGKYWSVKISMVNGSLAFQKGWSHFFSAHSIAFGELVLFTYTGGLLFTARIFENSGLERLDFQIKKRSGKCAKEMGATELKPDNVLPSKRMKASHASEGKQNPSINELLRMLKRGKEGAQFDFPDIEIVESDSISEGVLEVPSAGVKLPRYDSNSKETENVFDDSEETSDRNLDVTVEKVNKVKELNIISTTEPEKSDADKFEAAAIKSFSSSNINMDATVEKVNTVEEKNIMSLSKPEKSDEENLEAVANKSIRSKMVTTEKVGSLFHSGRALVSKLAKKPDTMAITDICTFLEHSDIKEGLPEMNSSYKIGIKGKMEESNSHDLEMIDSEPHNDNIAAQSNLQHAESNQMELNMVKPNANDDIILLTADGICHTFDEKFAAPATGTSFDVNGQVKPICQSEHATCCPETSAPSETISVVSSNPILICANKTKKESLMQTSEEYEDHPIKGSSIRAESGFQGSTKVHECNGHNAFIDEDIKVVTPCSSCRNGAITARRDSVDIPLSSYFSFSVCSSDDAQYSLEIPKKLASQMGKLKNERKVVVLQDPSMRCWPVLYHDSTKFTGFIGGWPDFARANNIARGDICEFALVNKMELKFRVQSSRRVGSISDEKSLDGQIG